MNTPNLQSSASNDGIPETAEIPEQEYDNGQECERLRHELNKRAFSDATHQVCKQERDVRLATGNKITFIDCDGDKYEAMPLSMIDGVTVMEAK